MSKSSESLSPVDILPSTDMSMKRVVTGRELSWSILPFFFDLSTKEMLELCVAKLRVLYTFLGRNVFVK